ncbi:hypothetical protein Lal_00001778 [Lupinus albus]|nr:hypothetical protein Lal_00001778 [Lupinus albus]
MKNGAERMCMTSPSIDEFVHALKLTVLANKRWVPPPGKGSLYLRPLLLGTGPVLGLAPSLDYTFLIYASPVRSYFKEGSAPLNLCVDEDFDRACPRGTASVKTISNYAFQTFYWKKNVLMAQTRAKSRGFSDVIYLDSATKKNVEEVSSCNIFIGKDKYISTPATNGTILPGITRKSVIEIARDQGYQKSAYEVFCTGTAVGVAPVGSITYQDRKVEYITGYRTICEELNTTLLGIQRGVIEDKYGWMIEID